MPVTRILENIKIIFDKFKTRKAGIECLLNNPIT